LIALAGIRPGTGRLAPGLAPAGRILARPSGKPVTAAITKALADAGKERPDDLNPATLR